MTGDRLLIPNIAAEEGPRWWAARREPAVLGLANLWRLLFGSDTQLLDLDSSAGTKSTESIDLVWPTALGAQPKGPVYEWLDAPARATAWLNTLEAAKLAAHRDLELAGPSPASVAIVHDKAFALRTAESERLQPRALRGLIEVLEPALLRDPDAAVALIEETIRRWPDWTRGRFTLKPRFGSSGRGRVGGEGIAPDSAAVRGGFARLAERGGALLEPWLDRTSDLSAQLHVAADGAVTLLGTLELCVAPSGLYRGHRGFVDAKGRVHAGTQHDEALREPAALLAKAAFAAGFTGPCGVDAFSFRAAEDCEELRGTVEFNARITAGIVVIGLLRRALKVLKAGIGIESDQRRAFTFALDAPPGGWPEIGSDSSLQIIRLWRPGESAETRPALLVGPDRESLDAAFASAPP